MCSFDLNSQKIVIFLQKILNDEMSLCHKLNFFNPYIFDTWWCTLCKPLIFHTWIIWSNRNHSENDLRSTTLGCKDIRIRKSEFVAKTQFFYLDLTRFHTYIFSIQYCIIRQPPPRKYWVGPLYPSIYLSVYLWPDKSSIS